MHETGEEGTGIHGGRECIAGGFGWTGSRPGRADDFRSPERPPRAEYLVRDLTRGDLLRDLTRGDLIREIGRQARTLGNGQGELARSTVANDDDLDLLSHAQGFDARHVV